MMLVVVMLMLLSRLVLKCPMLTLHQASSYVLLVVAGALSVASIVVSILVRRRLFSMATPGGMLFINNASAPLL
jgi:hypothetical protein